MILRKPTLLRSTALFGLLFFLASCERPQDLISYVEMRYNLSNVAPLTAQLELQTSRRVALELRVKGHHGEASDVVLEFPSLSDDFSIPVLGLYSDTTNVVELTLREPGGELLESKIFELKTKPASENLPQIRIDQRSIVTSEADYYLVNYFGHTEGRNFVPQTVFIFDQFGDIRWYLDYLPDPIFRNLFYDNGLSRLENGNLLMGDRNSDAIYEIDRQGVALGTWPLNGYSFHHHVIEKPDNNLIATVNKNGLTTVEDHILELDSKSGNIVREWDLRESLQKSRTIWDTDLADINVDWFHANGLAYSESDNTLIVSGRTQGTVKLTPNNELIWILAPHLGWGQNGRGQDLASFLLQPLDANGNPITDQAVLNGEANHPDFEWAWYQHAPVVMPNGNLMLFDNGDNRNYQQAGSYSRAVEYKIDEDEMTIQQVWSYGKERGEACYSRIVSAVAYHEAENTVLFTPGAVVSGGESYGKVVEVDYASKEVLFEATVIAPVAPFNITFHNIKRMGLYP